MTEERITAYLLHELPKGEAEQFEEQCFAQPEWPGSELESAEDDLIEAYVRNELSRRKRRRFEKYYLTTTARKDRVLLARSFMRVVCSAEPQKPGWLDWCRDLWNTQAVKRKYASAVIVVMLGVVLLIWSIKPHSTPPTFATFSNLNLTITSENRSQGASTAQEKIKLPLGADALRVSLTLPEPAPEGAAYTVQWENAKGPLKTLPIESQNADSINVIIPADELVPGRYALKLLRKTPDGTEERIKGSYFFEVE